MKRIVLAIVAFIVLSLASCGHGSNSKEMLDNDTIVDTIFVDTIHLEGDSIV